MHGEDGPCEEISSWYDRWRLESISRYSTTSAEQPFAIHGGHRQLYDRSTNTCRLNGQSIHLPYVCMDPQSLHRFQQYWLILYTYCVCVSLLQYRFEAACMLKVWPHTHYACIAFVDVSHLPGPFISVDFSLTMIVWMQGWSIPVKQMHIYTSQPTHNVQEDNMYIQSIEIYILSNVKSYS